MPELPEVENLRLGLVSAIVGQKIRSVTVEKPKLVSGRGTLRTASVKKKTEFIKGLTGERFVDVERRAKNLVFRLSHDKIILVHLKMSGQFAYSPFGKGPMISGGHPIELSEKQLPNKHTHVTFELEKGMLYYNDTRMFGYLLYYPHQAAFESEKHFDAYGVEPLSKEFTAKYFIDKLKDKRGKLKAVLLEQQIVTGLGNIYVDESLFEARIRPDRSPDSLSGAEAQKLHKAIVRIITRAVHIGGSSVATYRLLDTTQGNYAREHKVYGKGGKLCSNCKKPLTKATIGGRTTIFCANCQK